MKKIISILIALGLVLSLTVMATPVAADIENVTVSVTSTDCAGEEGEYTIDFDTEASLTQGVGCVCIKFPADTTVPASFEDGDIEFNTVAVFESEVTVTGLEVCFIPPVDSVAGPQTVEFLDGAGIINPTVAGDDYTLEVRTCRAPDSEYVESDPYSIVPAISEYALTVDFGPTYPGIAEDFVPPFKMCGQNDSVRGNESFDTVWNASIPGWLTVFNLTFAEVLEGCDAACDNATIWFELVTCPEDEVITLGLNGTWFELTSANITEDVCEFDKATDWEVGHVLLATNMSPVTWNASLHFSSPGKYEICFKAECPEVTCVPPDEYIIAKRCLKCSVYQWKEAYKIPLYHKWNLISLPLVPLVDPPIMDILGSYPFLDDIISVWYYDRCEGDDGTWYVYPAGIEGGDKELTTMEDGKAYWIRIAYNSTPGFQMGDAAGALWVWGTLKPVPPSSPSAYPVCEGWNMIGFTELVWNMFDGTYLWNFPFPTDHGAVYGWQAPTQSWFKLCHNLIVMWPGEGYWASFSRDGTIYPP